MSLDQLDTYDYDLPPELIAQEPLPQRDASRLLVVRRSEGTIAHDSIRSLAELLDPGDCLVLNNSRVLPARLFGIRTATGGKWEGLFLSTTDSGVWRLIGQTRGWLRPGETVTITVAGQPDLVLTMLEREAEGVWRMMPSLTRPVHEVLEVYGVMPLPPYIERTAMAVDQERYQTTYASQPGSVAAPTAGLHLTPELLNRCRQRSLSVAEVTLHVGIGTFRPVSTQDLSQHVMHAEWCELPQATAEKLAATRAAGGRIVAVGTTSARTLESAYRAAGFQEWSGETRLFMRPPDKFQAIDALLTNFHLPKSTLLMLVSSLAGVELMQRAYAAAIAERYRFFSYGDAMLIL